MGGISPNFRDKIIFFRTKGKKSLGEARAESQIV